MKWILIGFISLSITGCASWPVEVIPRENDTPKVRVNLPGNHCYIKVGNIIRPKARIKCVWKV